MVLLFAALGDGEKGGTQEAAYIYAHAHNEYMRDGCRLVAMAAFVYRQAEKMREVQCQAYRETSGEREERESCRVRRDVMVGAESRRWQAESREKRRIPRWQHAMLYGRRRQAWALRRFQAAGRRYKRRRSGRCFPRYSRRRYYGYAVQGAVK